MMVAKGILTARGGLVSHAAVVARGWGTPAVVGADAIKIARPQFTAGDVVVQEGDVISLDGTTGEVILGAVLAERRPSRRPSSTRSSTWADQIRKGHLAVRANADNGPDAANARAFGAEGIGLCRTEHMFLGEDRLPVVRRMILAAHAGRGGRRPRGAAPRPEGRLRGDPRGDGRPARHGPPARPAAARVPAARGRAGAEAGDRRPLDRGGAAAQGGARLARVQPDARHARRAPRRREAGPVRHAGAGAHGGGGRAGRQGRQADRRDHDPAHRHPRGAARGPHAGWRTPSRRPPPACARSPR